MSNNKNEDMKDKDEAVREWVAREFNAVSQEWVRIAMEHFGYGEPPVPTEAATLLAPNR